MLFRSVFYSRFSIHEILHLPHRTSFQDVAVIASFHDEETRKVWQGIFSRKLPQQIQAIARRKLRMLNNAKSLEDLRIPPNNRLELLRGKRVGQYSIRINEQWRLCFLWEHGNAEQVEICDYH